MARIIRVLTIEKGKEGLNNGIDVVHNIFEFDLDVNRNKDKHLKAGINNLLNEALEYDWGFGAANKAPAEIEELKGQWSLGQSLNMELLRQNEGLANNVKIKSDLAARANERIKQLFKDKVDLEIIIAKKVDAIDALEMDVVALKAKLYDLMNKGGKK